MRVLVLNNAVPFVRGGAEELAEHLLDRLNRTPGVEAELLRVPFRWEPAERIVDQIVINRNLRLYKVDRVIGLKFPAYLIPHPHKTLWLLHQFRQAYDLYESGLSHLCGHRCGKEIARQVHEADQHCFAECRAVFTNSPVTQARLKKFNGRDAAVLYPPLLDPERFHGGELGDYIFAGGRISPGKRQHLLVEAMRHTRSAVKLVVAGPSEDAKYLSRLLDIIARYRLSDRVDVRARFHSRDEVAGLVNGALATAYLPIDEDSLGFVTMEAFCAGKAMVTSRDAGGLLEIVRDQETGFVVDPTAAAIGRVFDQLVEDITRTKDMGRAGRSLLASKQLNWDETIARLLS